MNGTIPEGFPSNLRKNIFNKLEIAGKNVLFTPRFVTENEGGQSFQEKIQARANHYKATGTVEKALSFSSDGCTNQWHQADLYTPSLNTQLFPTFCRRNGDDFQGPAP